MIAYIHIGLPKTGTTSLQAFMRANRALLLRDGIVYPDTTGRDNGNATPAALALLGPTPAYFRASNPKYDEAQLDFKACWRELLAEAVPGKALLLSSEDLALVPARDFRERSAFDGLEKRFIVYLRRQDLVIEKSYLQEVMAGTFTGPFEEYVEDFVVNRNPDRGIFDYEQLLRQLSDAFGVDRVTVLVYEEQQAIDWIFTSLLESLGLSLRSEHLLPGRLNATLHPLVIEFVRRRRIAGGFQTRRVREAAEVVAREGLAAGVPTSLLSPTSRRAILARAEGGNRWVAERFCPQAPATLFPAAAIDRPGDRAFVPEEHEAAYRRIDRLETEGRAAP